MIDRDTFTGLLSSNPQLQALVRSGTLQQVPDGDVLSLQGEDLAFLVTGTVRIHKQDLSLLARAPLLLECETGVEVTAVHGVRWLHVPRTAGLAELTLQLQPDRHGCTRPPLGFAARCTRMRHTPAIGRVCHV